MACAFALTSWYGPDVSAQTRVKRAEIVDHVRFEMPLLASTFPIPVYRHAEGGVVWKWASLHDERYNPSAHALG